MRNDELQTVLNSSLIIHHSSFLLRLTPAPPAGKISAYALPSPLRGVVLPRPTPPDNCSPPADAGGAAAACARACAGGGRHVRARPRRGLARRAAREEPDGARVGAGRGGLEAR